LRNLGSVSVENLEVELRWNDKYGNVLHKITETLISENNQSLNKGRDRIFNLFSPIPRIAMNQDKDFSIRINRIN
ncbi:MAG: hypothetical protein JEY91_08325, partial [Spirochaetaceae bacterium]|nr:hypothetical protein [Spirochaetaceae bacterium]